MATYAIGDIQGCFDELQQLIEKIHFDPSADRLWFTGDLVNRGPKSLETLRLVKALDTAALTVLGNHDLHLLAVWQNKQHHFKPNDSLGAIFRADDGEELLEWLRTRPLMHYDESLDVAMVHAGLPPQWDRDKALACAAEVETVLRGPKFHEFLSHMYGNKPDLWSDNLQGWERMRFIVNCFTRLRFCTSEGRLDFKHKGMPGEGEHGYLPWFAVPERQNRDLTVVFGHWSTLGLYQENNVHAIDTGCLWGGSLSALRLEDGRVFSLPCEGYSKPG
ncbi:MAG: symmetrical bis(5'-nucleosyl)-tetraphosphatase [Pseudomonadota bacterium]